MTSILAAYSALYSWQADVQELVEQVDFVASGQRDGFGLVAIMPERFNGLAE
jgi:hypothetical protein